MPPTNSPALPLYYRTEITKVTVREIWRVLFPNLLGILYVLVRKLLGLPIRTKLAYATSPVFLDVAQFPADVTASMQSLRQQLEAAGFRLCFGHSVPTVGPMEGYCFDFLDRQDFTWGAAIYSRAFAAGHVREERLVVLASQLGDGTIVSTTNARRRLNPPPGVSPTYATGKAVPELMALHAERLSDRAVMCFDAAELRRLIVEMGDRNVQFHLRRGVFVPVDPAELT